MSSAWRTRGEGEPIQLVAHRGHHAGPSCTPESPPGLPPENTLSAFEAALSASVHAVELDVRVCATGEVVVFHDPDLSRLTGGADRRLVAEVPWSELRALRVGGHRERIPLLVEVLDLCRARSAAVNVEWKHDVPSLSALASQAARVLLAWDPLHDVVVSSFHPALVAAASVLLPRRRRAQLVHPSWYRSLELAGLTLLGAHGVHLDRALAAPARVRALRRRGYYVAVWTVNDPREAAALCAAGADALITDAPSALAASLGRWR